MQIFEFDRLAVININKVATTESSTAAWKVTIHDLYRDYAAWFLGDDRNKKALGFCCDGEEFRPLPFELQRSPPGNCWPDLKRIRLDNIRPCDNFPVGKVLEWRNVVVLQIVGCEDLTAINLQGLSCLRQLELRFLVQLQTLTFTGDGSSSTSSVSQGTYTQPRPQYLLPPLRFVTTTWLPCVNCLPSFSQFTSLKLLKVKHCGGLT